MKTDKTETNLLSAAAREIGDKAPDEFVLITPGEVVYTNRKPHPKVNFTPELFNKIVANFARLAKDVVFDYEHQTMTGAQAPAAGWINSLSFDPDRGLVAHVKEWTQKAKAYIENKEYRFFSPVVDLAYTDTRSGEKIGPVLHSVALTNDPLMYWLEPLTSKHNPQTEEKEMEEFLKLLAAKLGLKEDATEKEIVEVLDGKLVASNRLASPEVFELLEAQADTDLEGIKALVAKLKKPTVPAGSKGDPDPEKYVAKADFDATKTELAELKAERAEEKAEKVVGEGVLAGKLTPAQKDWALDYAKSNPEGFAAYIAKAPVVVPREEIVKGEGATPNSESLIAKYITDNKCNYKTAAIAVAKAHPELF